MSRRPSPTGRRDEAWARPAGVILTVSLLVAEFAVTSSAVVLARGPSNGVDSLLYAVTLIGLAPAALLVGRRLAGAVQLGAGPVALSVLASRAAAALLLVVLVARLAHTAGSSSSIVFLVATPAWGVWLALAARSLRSGDPFIEPPAPVRSHLVAAVLACLCVPAFVSADSLRPLPLASSLALAAGLTALYLRRRTSALRRWMPRVLDIAVVLVLLLAVTDVTGYLEYQQPGADSERVGDIVASPELLLHLQRAHQGFWLAPVNDVLHGRALLVDTSSQYGVGSIYFLAAFFSVAPIGYGALGLLTGLLTGVQYAVAYGVMRLVGVGRTLAVAVMSAALLGLVLGSFGSPADFPATGGLRFGLPWLVVALAVLAVRRPHRRRLLWAAAAAMVGVASIWSLEVFAYSGAALLGAGGFMAASRPSGSRTRVFARLMVPAAACCVVAHLALAVSTRALAGAWPDWSEYLAFLGAYSGGDLYSLPVGPWSPGLPLLAVLLASALGVAALLASRRELAAKHAPAVMAIAATTGFGIVSFSYFVGHSDPNTLKYVALPGLVTACLWAPVAGPGLLSSSRALRVVVLGGAFWAVALIAVSGVSDARKKWHRTALATAAPGLGGGSRTALPRLWHSPPSDQRAPEAQSLLDRHLPTGVPALVIAEPDLTVETLVRGDRINLLPLGDPEQDNLIRSERLATVMAAVDRLPAGTLMLLQTAALEAPAKPTALPPYAGPGKIVALQKRALDRIRARFVLQTVESGPSGLAIVRLVSRRVTG